jgi:AbrB family looped-hinge helix DNA binding protein
MKANLVPIDKAGRVVLPKSVREELAIKPGDVLKVGVQGVSVTLTKSSEGSGLVRRGQALVFSTPGENHLTVETVEELRSREQDDHAWRNAGKLGGKRPVS